MVLRSFSQASGTVATFLNSIRPATREYARHDGAFMTRLGIVMTESDLSTRVALAQHSRDRRSAPGLIGCRGEIIGQTGVIVYEFRDAASANAFQMRRQIDAKPLRLEILDKMPSEVREYVE
jgi:hypothetical protein